MVASNRGVPLGTDVLVVGVDIAKKAHVVVALPGAGRPSKAVKIEVSRKGFEALGQQIDQWRVQFKLSRVVVALEPTGHYGETLCHWLGQRDVEIRFVQPLHTSRFKEVIDGTSRKTDAKDAFIIANLCRQGFATAFAPLTGPFAELRVLTRQREQLVVRQTETRCRLHRFVDRLFPELADVFPKLRSAAVLAVLERCPTPAELLATPRSTITKVLKQVSNHRYGLRSGRVDALYDAAAVSIGVPTTSVLTSAVVRQLIAELRSLDARLHEIERMMARTLTQVPYAAQIQTIPHVGVVTAATILGEYGDLRRFGHARQLIAMAGLVLVEQSSGTHRGRHHISRRGSPYARRILFLAGLRLARTAFRAPLREGQPKRCATKVAIANAARLLRVVYAMVRDDASFEASRREIASNATAA